MPEYIYTDGENEILVVHPFDWDGQIITGSGVQMWRKPPNNVAVNWGGLKPSDAAGRPGHLEQHLDENNLARQRAEFERTHEEHERATDNE